MSQFSFNLRPEPETKAEPEAQKDAQADAQAKTVDIAPKRQVWQVSEITARLRAMMEGEFPDVWVEGEISNCRPAQSGHCYFTLKDARAQIKCVCFREQMRILKFRPEDGLQVTVRGGISIYDQRGEYQIYVQQMEPAGLGALQLAFEQLKKRLEAEGLFAEEKKKALPVLPRRIGVITSPTGAAVRDIVRVLTRRFPNLHVAVYPVRVQGDGAAMDVVTALRYFGRVDSVDGVDVLILARGGGSLEDLWAFNEEIVAYAIARSEIPVITGIGHESDFTIADFVADVRAATPSAAAEIVVRTRAEFEKHVGELERRAVQQSRYLILRWRARVRDLESHGAFRQLETMVRGRRQLIDELGAELGVALRARVRGARQRLALPAARIAAFSLHARAEKWRSRVDATAAGLRGGLGRALVRKRRRFTAAQMGMAASGARGLQARVSRLRARLERASVALEGRAAAWIALARRRVETAELRLQERSPFQLLERGYAIAYDAGGRVLRSAEQVAAGEGISVKLARGEVDAKVTGVRNGEKT
jgi:exodeoxyribonuclease VII large subunit